ncbi:DUF2798 domain-containing protein [Floricoccus penangensis]|uniref:DUF2798 domain-containing protein n=1 Tax=Floricoccus penangensis TaxID=1859475 RepID=A0A9Q5JEB7_9LACT|nr:DUF2798 domain-containing protein [Floricoccus penangensis]OFI45775.1 DUF2798 domain-containing protein [Floricoccus penangensis]
MPINKKESLIYTSLMCFFMVYIMSVYNIVLEIGFSSQAFIGAWVSLPLALVVGFICDVYLVSPNAKGLAFKFIKEDSPLILKILIISTCMVTGMVICMSLFGAIMHNGLNYNLFKAWLINIPRNFVMALPLQIFIAGPIVRKIFRGIFPVGTIQDIK